MIIPALLLALSSATRAGDTICEPAAPRLERKIAVNDTVNYFTRSNPADQEISFATANGNRILNVDTEKFSEAPGQIDPVISPDGKIVAIPLTAVIDTSGRVNYISPKTPQEQLDKIKYAWASGKVMIKKEVKDPQPGQDNAVWEVTEISLSELKNMKVPYGTSLMTFFPRANLAGNPLLTDASVTYNYQSLGVVQSGPDETHYRMLYESEAGIKIKEYTLDNHTNRFSSSDEPHLACPSSDDMSLPMISKDGKEFSVYNNVSGHTEIYRMDRSRGSCELTDSIPFMTGKTDFSPNGRYVAFHVDEGMNDVQGNMSSPTDENQLAAFVYDRNSKKMIPLQNKKGEQSYYPVFLSNDRVAFMTESTDDDKKQHFFINVVNMGTSQLLTCQDCTPKTKNGQLAAVIGYLYGKHCQDNSFKFAKEIGNFMKLTTASCKSLIQSSAESDLANLKNPDEAQKIGLDPGAVSGISNQDLLRLCEPSQAPPPQPAPSISR